MHIFVMTAYDFFLSSPESSKPFSEGVNGKTCDRSKIGCQGNKLDNIMRKYSIFQKSLNLTYFQNIMISPRCMQVLTRGSIQSKDT